jgi:hypothetical protein
MIDLKLDVATSDLAIIDSDLQLISESEWLEQKLKIKLQFFYQEWFLDTTVGVDYFNTILGKNRDPNLIDNAIKLTITEELEVTEIVEYNSNYNALDRNYTISFVVNSIYGQIRIEEELAI